MTHMPNPESVNLNPVEIIEPLSFDEQWTLAHRTFGKLSTELQDAPADIRGDVVIAQPTPTGDDPERFVVVRRFPITPMPAADAFNAAMLGVSLPHDRFVRRQPTRMEQWADQTGLKGTIGRLTLKLTGDSPKEEWIARDPEAGKVLQMNSIHGEIVTPGVQPSDEYTLTLYGPSEEYDGDPMVLDRLSLQWNGVSPYFIDPNDRLAQQIDGKRITSISEVILDNAAQVLQPDHGLELRQRGPQAEITGVEAQAAGRAADAFLRNILGVTSDVLTDSTAHPEVADFWSHESADLSPEQSSVQRVQVIQRASTVHSDLLRHRTEARRTTPVRSVITRVFMNPINETDEDQLIVHIENLYDKLSGDLVTSWVQYGRPMDTMSPPEDSFHGRIAQHTASAEQRESLNFAYASNHMERVRLSRQVRQQIDRTIIEQLALNQDTFLDRFDEF